MIKVNKILLSGFVSLIVLSGCYKEEVIAPGTGLEDWTEESHGSTAEPNYDIVFNQSEVNRIDIVIDRPYWDVSMDDLETMYGGQQQQGFSDENPIYIPCDVYFKDKKWHKVGFRWKGNSSLKSAYSQGKMKLPMRLEFNHFEDENPLVWGQTFYGFQQISLSNNYQDNTMLAEKVSDDLLREFGIPVARSAFYRVYVDYGDGPIYFGMYTAVEVVFDTAIKNCFGNNGVCYKAEGNMGGGGGSGCRFDKMGFMDGYKTDFVLKTEYATDFSDLLDMYNALHDPTRMSDKAAWRAGLEAVFNVDGFLKWLAANTTMQNWDTYGRAPHNYYLYHNPDDDRLHWIPWDHNEMFSNGHPPKNTPLPFDMNPQELGGGWPLIRFLYDDPVYKKTYQQYIEDFINGPFLPSKMQTQYTNWHNMIQPYITGSEGESIPVYSFMNSYSDFDNSLPTLIQHCQDRYTAADAYIPW